MPDKNPWDDDLAEKFEDEDVREAVSEFLGEKVQPYVTKLEQESKPDRDATLLWEQFHEEPVSTTIQVIRELYGEDKADAFAAILQGEETEAPESGDVTKENEGERTEPSEPTDTSVKFEQLPPEVQEMIQNQKLEESRKAYYSEIDRIKEEHKDELPKDDDGNPRLDADTFHPFVVAAEGNFDEAYKGFQSWIDAARREAGLVTEEATEGNEPPPVFSSKTRDASSKVPAQPKNQTIDGALDEMFEELKAPPPTVGGV
jgi:hypothetical protein